MSATRTKSSTPSRTVLPVLAAAALFAAPIAAMAQTDSTESYSYKRPSPTTITTFGSLVDLCSTPDSSADYVANHAVCGGYFSGFIDLYLAETPQATRAICLPSPPITRDQARMKFATWSAANPSFASQPASVGVYRFLTASYPCVGATAPTAMPPAPLAAKP